MRTSLYFVRLLVSDPCIELEYETGTALIEVGVHSCSIAWLCSSK